MNILDKARLLQTSMLTGLLISFAGTAYAQTSDEDVAEEIELIEEDADDYSAGSDEVVVTGSRLKKDTFSSISPLQVINTDIAAEQGLFSPVDILQSSSTASGQQIDSTFQGFVLDNGPGSETIDLRGLGASRTLVLLNGRRIAPAGVEGAPSQPSINLIPATLVDGYDILTDGASSVYGSDAVAGVINVRLKNDFDGLEVDFFADSPEMGDGQDYTLGASYGINNDRGFIGVGGEYDFTEGWTTGDRDFLDNCTRYLEVTENGNILSENITQVADAAAQGLSIRTSECLASRNTQRILIDYRGSAAGGNGRYGSLYYRPDLSGSGIPNYNFLSQFGTFPDYDNDGEVDIIAQDFSPNGQQADAQQLQNEQKRTSLMAVGEYTFEGDMNITPYFEALYSHLKTEATGGQGQLFPFVPANNPFNPCNPNAQGGVDCGLARDAAFSDPGFIARFAALNGGTPQQFTDAGFGVLTGALGPLRLRPVIGVLGDRNNVKTDLEQTRIVLGTRGDLPMINFGSVKDWSFDASFTHSYADGSASRSGVREDRLSEALGTDYATGADTAGPCIALDGSAIGGGCVPVNLFAPSLMGVAAGGDFATQAERDFIFDTRDFDTYYAQTIGEVYVQGDLFTLPGGDVSMLLGASIRKDEINSQPDEVARDGLFFGFFNDGGAVGEKVTKEAYGEISIPLGTGKTFFREFNIDLAGRLTDDEFYGTNETYSIKAGYRPVDSLLLRGTLGTSFRAPNLRENFLAGQSGFGNVSDPCLVPADALGGGLTGGGYDRSLDTRTDITLANCRAQGVDPESFGGGGFGAYSVEIEGGGTFDLEPEESDSFTLGFSFEQPFTDFVDFEFGATYYDIDISNTVIEPSSAFIVNDCLVNNPNLQSAFCSRITRDPNDGAIPGRISLIDNGFINRNRETARGIDFSADLGKNEVIIMNKSVDFALSARVNHLLERKTIDLLDGQTEPDIEEFKGEFGFSKWRGFVTGRASVDKFRFTWTTRFQTKVGLDEEDRDVPDFTNINDSGLVVTCTGNPNCRPVYDADDYFLHNASVAYRADSWGLVVGVNNVFDKAPELVDPFEVFSVNNVSIGNGYDLQGREYFVRLNKTF